MKEIVRKERRLKSNFFLKEYSCESDYFRIFDSDGNGSLDFKEFLMALDIAQCQDERQKLEWSFRYLDQPVTSFFLFQVVFVGLEWLHNSQISNCKSRTKILFYLLLKTCRMYDVDDSGCINLQEMTNIIATMDELEGDEKVHGDRIVK